MGRCALKAVIGQTYGGLWGFGVVAGYLLAPRPDRLLRDEGEARLTVEETGSRSKVRILTGAGW